MCQGYKTEEVQSQAYTDHGIMLVYWERAQAPAPIFMQLVLAENFQLVCKYLSAISGNVHMYIV